MAEFDEKKQEKKIEALHKKEEEDLANILSKKYKLEYADLSKLSINTDALRLVPEEKAREAEVAAFAKVGKKLSVAIRTPNNSHVKAITEELDKLGYTVTLYMVSSQSLMRAWERYKELSFAVETKAGILDISGEEIKRLLNELKTLEEAKKAIESVLGMKKAYRISRILETVLAGSLASKSSDIHIEPEEEYVRLRFRIDGVLLDALHFDTETYNLLLSRIKLLSGLKLNVKSSAQDGRFSVHIDQSDIEIRTSILPGAYGESIVLRILNPKTISLPIEELGMEPKLLEILEKEIRKPNGMILNTGPTGSGKTTTLYAFLRKIHTPEIKILTIEDPIEYHLPGIVQTQVDKKRYTFEQGLRSGLRQDPDVIMVGEIRDQKVAQTAINAALTGHLVFSTLHTNNAAGSFPRLLDLGVSPKVISSAINIVMAQRLVRKLIPDSKKEVKLSGKQKEYVQEVLESITDKGLIPNNTEIVWEPARSEDFNTGYSGRIGVFEAIVMDENVERVVEGGGSEREIQEVSTKQKTLTMKQDAVIKMLQGVTSFQEIKRVLDVSASDA